MTAHPDFAALHALDRPPIARLFADDPDRLTALSIDVAGVHFDLAKTHLAPPVLDAFETIATAMGLTSKRDALFAGAVVNVTEGRAAEHSAERGEGAPDAVAAARALQGRMRALVDAIEADAMGPIRHVLHIGIGGSALGPKLVLDALGHDGELDRVAVLSNIDGIALERAVARFDPHATLICVASKTFTTAETLLNAASALRWLEEAGVADPMGRVIALTAAPDKAVAWGVDETRVLPFSPTVGGRYSLWSSIGFPIAIGLGWTAFAEMLEGAAAMDRHFRLAPLTENAPVLAAFSDLYYAQGRGCATRAVFAYDERLRLLPDYLQQLEMESNGKSVTADGRALDGPSAPVTWGGVGTDAQHAVFQLLHQGTQMIPVEFIGVIEPGDAQDPEHHRQLLVNAFAQGAALMTGRAADDPARAYPGDRPSTTVLLDRLDARTLGTLIAFYEHRTFASAALLGINPFDQFGVELGKEMAKRIDDPATRDAFDASTRDLIARAGV